MVMDHYLHTLLKVSSFNKQITSFMLWKMYVMHLHHETKNDMIGVYYIEKECIVTSPFTERTLKSYPFPSPIGRKSVTSVLSLFPKGADLKPFLSNSPAFKKERCAAPSPFPGLIESKLFLFRSLFFLFAEYFYGKIIKYRIDYRNQ